jgi:hypothetical protein
MSIQSAQFDFDMVIDTPDAFVSLVYDCKQRLVCKSDDGDQAFVDNTATLIRASKLTAQSERVWQYGENKPKWLVSFFDGHADEIESRIRDRFTKESPKFFSTST